MRVLLAIGVVLGLVAISAPWFQIPSDNADGAGMRAHLHALFEARDLLYDDEYAQLRMSPLFAFVTEAGLVSNHWPIGASFVQAPGWLLGRVAGAGLVGGEGGISERAATWDIPLLGLRTWAVLVLALVLAGLARWLTPRVGRGAASLAVVAAALGTPLLYYAAEAPERPHLWGFAVVTWLVVRWFAAVGVGAAPPSDARASAKPAIELAVYAGLATAIRPQLGMLALLVAHERWVASARLELRPRLLLLLRHGAMAAAAFAVWPALVVLMQRWMYAGLSDYQGEVSLHLRGFLFSTHHGALVWCPVLVLGLLGLAIGASRREQGAGLLLALLAAQIWLDAGTREIEPFAVLGTRTWTGGTSFGPRKLVDAMPLLLPGVVWIVRWLGEQGETERGKWRRRLTSATVLACVPTTLLLAAAWLDPHVCSDVLDGERLVNAMTIPFDADTWTQMAARRHLPGRVTTRVAAIVGVPLAALLALAWLAATRTRSVGEQDGQPPAGRGGARLGRVAWVLVLAYGLAADLWVVALQRRTEAMIAADPGRIAAARARLDPIHELLVREIPSHQAVLRARLGPDI